MPLALLLLPLTVPLALLAGFKSADTIARALGYSNRDTEGASWWRSFIIYAGVQWTGAVVGALVAVLVGLVAAWATRSRWVPLVRRYAVLVSRWVV